MIALLFVIFEIQKESLATSLNTYQTAGSNLKILLFVHISYFSFEFIINLAIQSRWDIFFNF